MESICCNKYEVFTSFSIYCNISDIHFLLSFYKSIKPVFVRYVYFVHFQPTADFPHM